jgi:hypothetical protein
MKAGDIIFRDVKEYCDERSIRIDKVYLAGYDRALHPYYVGEMISRGCGRWVFSCGGSDDSEDFTEADLAIILNKLRELNARV